jgi:hypothetical protein
MNMGMTKARILEEYEKKCRELAAKDKEIATRIDSSLARADEYRRLGSKLHITSVLKDHLESELSKLKKDCKDAVDGANFLIDREKEKAEKARSACKMHRNASADQREENHKLVAKHEAQAAKIKELEGHVLKLVGLI